MKAFCSRLLGPPCVRRCVRPAGISPSTSRAGDVVAGGGASVHATRRVAEEEAPALACTFARRGSSCRGAAARELPRRAQSRTYPATRGIRRHESPCSRSPTAARARCGGRRSWERIGMESSAAVEWCGAVDFTVRGSRRPKYTARDAAFSRAR